MKDFNDIIKQIKNTIKQFEELRINIKSKVYEYIKDEADFNSDKNSKIQTELYKDIDNLDRLNTLLERDFFSMELDKKYNDSIKNIDYITTDIERAIDKMLRQFDNDDDYIKLAPLDCQINNIEKYIQDFLQNFKCIEEGIN